MNDEETEGLMDLFEENQSEISKPIKPSYEPIHLPLSIIEILQIWSNDSRMSSSTDRVGLCPCDIDSLDGMFIHTWGEYHIEQPTRLTSIIEHLHHYFWIQHQIHWKLIPGRMINNKEIELVHSEKFLEEFLSIERGEIVDQSVAMRTLSYANVEYDFPSVGPIIARACRLATGTVLELISSIVRGELDFGFALIRPAGHHSSRDQIGTFCGLNSIAIGAVYAIEHLHLNRIVILDWDIHRSGGTEQILGHMSNEDQHQYRLIDIYAAFGQCSHSNVRPWNCQLIDMSNENQIPGDQEYLQIFQEKIVPEIIEYSPSLILISAGFDGAQGEKEECAQLTSQGYFQMTNQLKELQIPLIFVLEGGYEHQTLIQSIEGTFKALFNQLR